MPRLTFLLATLALLSACGAGDATESRPDASPPPSLVGTWHTVLPLNGRPTEVLWQARGDGTCAYRLAQSGSGASIPCVWQLQGDVLHETAQGGPPSSARVRWNGNDRVTLTIIDNGEPRETGTVRQYSRKR